MITTYHQNVLDIIIQVANAITKYGAEVTEHDKDYVVLKYPDNVVEKHVLKR